MIELDFSDGFIRAERALAKFAAEEFPNAIAKALTLYGRRRDGRRA